MPFVKGKYYRKKRTYPNKYKYTRNTMQLAGKALSIALATKRLLNTEHKFIDTQLDDNVTTTTQFMQLTNLSQGTSVTSREGDQIKITSLQMKYLVSQSSVATSSSYIRCMLVLDKQTNKSQFAISDLLQDSTATDAIISPLNLDNKYRFTILYNKVHSFSTSGNRSIYKEKYIKKEITIRYGDNTGSISDLNTNSIYFVLVSSEATNGVAADVYIRLRFVDN